MGALLQGDPGVQAAHFVVLEADPRLGRAAQDGLVTFAAVTSGKHTLKLLSRLGQAEVDFELVPVAVPQLGAMRNEDLPRRSTEA